jgi:hypothetical protein
VRIRPSRRDMIGMTSAGMSALFPKAQERSPAARDHEHTGNIEVRTTAGAQRFLAQPALKWRPLHAESTSSIFIDPGKRFQVVWGAHYSWAVRRGALRIESTSGLKGVSHVAFANPDGSKVAVLTNAGEAKSAFLRVSGKEAELRLPQELDHDADLAFLTPREIPVG